MGVCLPRGEHNPVVLRRRPSRLDAYAWNRNNARAVTHPVGLKRPNAFGLFDMHGNVWEWCRDFYQPGYPEGDAVDPKGPSSGRRTSSEVDPGITPRSGGTRSAERIHHSPGYRCSTYGFRVRRSVTPLASPPRAP